MFVRYLLLLSLCVFAYTRYIKDSEDYDGSEGDASEDIYKINEKAQSQEKGVTNFQTDMILTPEQIAVLKYNKNRQGDAVIDPRMFWPANPAIDGSITIPYILDQGFVGKSVVQAAAAHIKEKVPCINFVDKTGIIGSDHDHIRFINGRGCYSYVGKLDSRYGNQVISLQNRGCLHKVIAIHEMMHALGYFHEQSRPDRDAYIIIKKENIPAAYLGAFRKANTGSENTVYDFSSVMHYGAYAYSKNGNATIVRKDGGAASTLGRRRGLSEIDAKRLRMKYCGEAATTKPGPATTATTEPGPATTATTEPGPATTATTKPGPATTATTEPGPATTGTTF